MSQGSWLEGWEVADFLTDAPGELGDLVLELREVVRKTAPEVTEAIKFGSLCYFKPGRPYGAIGGNVCMIGIRDECVYLQFIHGVSLPDPQGLLEGTAKAKRQIPIRARADLRKPGLRELIRAAVAHDPAAE